MVIDNRTLKAELQSFVENAFKDAGYDPALGSITRSKLPDMAQFQCNGAFAASKKYGTEPVLIAEQIAKVLSSNPIFSKVSVAAPGFINLFVSDTFLASALHNLRDLGPDPFIKTETSETIVLDYGGANIAKPLHVGHLRPAIIGESIKRIGRCVGHTIIGDVHLGDWGLQMGMVITELEGRFPDLPYFDPEFQGDYPTDSPVTIDDLDTIYPEASKKAKTDESIMRRARKATVELQHGRPGYRALWKHFVNVSVEALRENYHALGVDFDLWLGESDAHESVVHLLEKLKKEGGAYESEGATIIDVGETSDTKEVPPLLLLNNDGAELYGATDLATIYDRVHERAPERILYVADKRQAMHFTQVFRAAKKTGVAPENVHLEHLGFGTMNGTDNRPFKTRDGGTMKLKDLINMISDKARERLADIQLSEELSEADIEDIVRKVGVASLKFADLSSHRTKDYVFDLERFSSFEGYTGPYLLYTAVRAGSILTKAKEQDLSGGSPHEPNKKTERELILALLDFPEVVQESWAERAPSTLADYTYNLATAFNSFYHECPILTENNEQKRAGYLTLVEQTKQTIEVSLDLLGMEAPERM